VADVAGVRIARERAAQRDHGTHGFGHRDREIARVDAAEAPADHGGLLAGPRDDLLKTLAYALAVLLDAAVVATQFPTVRVVAEQVEVIAEHRGGDVAYEKSRQHEHGVSVAARRSH